MTGGWITDDEKCIYDLIVSKSGCIPYLVIYSNLVSTVILSITFMDNESLNKFNDFTGFNRMCDTSMYYMEGNTVVYTDDLSMRLLRLLESHG